MRGKGEDTEVSFPTYQEDQQNSASLQVLLSIVGFLPLYNISCHFHSRQVQLVLCIQALGIKGKATCDKKINVVFVAGDVLLFSRLLQRFRPRAQGS